VTTLKVGHNILDNLFLDTVAEAWGENLKEFHIDVNDSYRNVRYSNMLNYRQDALNWEQINSLCPNCKVHFTFAGRPPNSFRVTTFCDQDDNYLSMIILTSKCKIISSMTFARTDYDLFVKNVSRGYECMSTQYRHFQVYKNSAMHKFIKVLRLKPSLTETLKTLSINDIDQLPNHPNLLRVSLMKFLDKNNALQSLYLKTSYNPALLDDIMLKINTHQSNLQRLHVNMVQYGDIIDKSCLLDKWAEPIEKLKEFTFDIIHRDALSDENSPTDYNEHIFQEWRRQLSLEIVDLTNEVS